MHAPRSPSLYQLNTRVWLTERSRALGRPATLDDFPDAELDRVAEAGFDWVWLLSVWQTGPAGGSRPNTPQASDCSANIVLDPLTASNAGRGT